MTAWVHYVDGEVAEYPNAYSAVVLKDSSDWLALMGRDQNVVAYIKEGTVWCIEFERSMILKSKKRDNA